MTENDRDEFELLISQVYDFYRQECSEFVLQMWWWALMSDELAAIKQAMTRHVRNPDAGQFRPWPADVSKMLQGRTVDTAAVAWAQVEQAARQIGPYRSVVFDDPIIHGCLEQIGGWIALGAVVDKEWPFKGNAFKTAYAGFRARSEVPPYPPVLIGISEAQNACSGQPVDPPLLIGNRERCQQVQALGGGSGLQVTFQQAGQQLLEHREAA